MNSTLGFSGRWSLKATPPVSKNLKCSPDNYPLNSKSLVHKRLEKTSLSFSNKDLHIFEYNEYRKKSFRFSRRVLKSSDLSANFIPYVKRSR